MVKELIAASEGAFLDVQAQLEKLSKKRGVNVGLYAGSNPVTFALFKELVQGLNENQLAELDRDLIKLKLFAYQASEHENTPVFRISEIRMKHGYLKRTSWQPDFYYFTFERETPSSEDREVNVTGVKLTEVVLGREAATLSDLIPTYGRTANKDIHCPFVVQSRDEVGCFENGIGLKLVGQNLVNLGQTGSRVITTNPPMAVQDLELAMILNYDPRKRRAGYDRLMAIIKREADNIRDLILKEFLQRGRSPVIGRIENLFLSHRSITPEEPYEGLVRLEERVRGREV